MTEKKFTVWVWVLSIAIPAVVTVLLYLPTDAQSGLNVRFIPMMNACINSSVSVLLLIGYYFIRQHKIAQHKLCMLSAVVMSAIFLILYVIYHYSVQETRFGGTGFIKVIYLFILLTHIVLAVVIVPLVLFTVFRALTGDFQRHKKVARWTFPLWLYVSVTGVLVYLMIAPYYPT